MKELFKNGDVYIWLTGVSLMFSLIMIAGLLLLIAVKGLGFFWPHDVVEIKLDNGNVYLGQYAGKETIPQLGKEKVKETRTRLKVGNRDLYGLDFTWVNDNQIISKSFPKNAVVLERREWGNFYGFLKEIDIDGKIIAGNSPDAFSSLNGLISEANRINREIRKIEKGILFVANPTGNSEEWDGESYGNYMSSEEWKSNLEKAFDRTSMS